MGCSLAVAFVSYSLNGNNKRSCAQQSCQKKSPLQCSYNHKQTSKHTQPYTQTNTTTAAQPHTQKQTQPQPQHACPVVSLQRNLAGRNKNTAAVSALEVNVPAHGAVVLADWLVQLHTTARDVLCGVAATEPQHTTTRVPLHTHALAHVTISCELACSTENKKHMSCKLVCTFVSAYACLLRFHHSSQLYPLPWQQLF